jgi:lambda family phage portal protein
MLAALKRLFTGKSPATSTRPGRHVRIVRARYDAADTSDENRRHWAHADGLSANASNNPEVRRVLRNRARYEVANNSYARGIVLTLANDTIGTGPRLQMLTENAEANRHIEREFHYWCKAIGLAEKLRTLRVAQTQDGESFALLTTNPKLRTPIQLDLRLVEADQVTTPGQAMLNPNAVDGIVFDDAGNPVEYHVLRAHPGETRGSLSLQVDAIPAESVLHQFRVDRPGQRRGVPEITPALPLFALLRDYSLATLDAAKAAAYYSGIIYTDAPANGESDSVEPLDPIELDRNTLLTMPGGWKMSQLHAEQPTGTYAEFKREVLNEIARCLNMPFNIAAGNSASYNYASGRMDHQVYFKAIRVDQAHLASFVLDRILAAWLDEAVLIPGFLPDGLGVMANWPHQWFWDGQEHVDPQKEASAQATRLASHTTTLADEYARRGQDWESQLRQRSKELSLMRQLGLSVDQAQPTTPPGEGPDGSLVPDPTEDPADVEDEPVADE